MARPITAIGVRETGEGRCHSDIVTSHCPLIGHPWSIMSSDWLMWSEQHGHGSQISPWCPINSITGHILHWWDISQNNGNKWQCSHSHLVLSFNEFQLLFTLISLRYDQRISLTLYLWKFASTSNLSALICYLTKVNFQHFIKLLLKLSSFKKAKPFLSNLFSFIEQNTFIHMYAQSNANVLPIQKKPHFDIRVSLVTNKVYGK